MRVAVFGGAFDPPHVGHAAIVSWILWTQRADKVLLVPSASHPFGKQMTPFETRAAYCEALADDVYPWSDWNPRGEGVLVSTVENTMPAPNYTINLLRRLQDIWGSGTKLRFVMGADNLARRAEWFGFDDIAREFDPIFVNRAGTTLPEGVEVMSPTFMDVSSTLVRSRLSAGLPVDHLVTRRVLEVISQK